MYCCPVLGRLVAFPQTDGFDSHNRHDSAGTRAVSTVKSGLKRLTGASDAESSLECPAEAKNLHQTANEVIIDTGMAFVSARIADAILPGSGIGVQLMSALLSSSATP